MFTQKTVVMKTFPIFLLTLILISGFAKADPPEPPVNLKETIVHGTTIKIMAHSNDEYLRIDKRLVKAAGNDANYHRLMIEKVAGKEGDGLLHNGDTFVLRYADRKNYFHIDGGYLASGASDRAATRFVIEKPGRYSEEIRSGDRVKIRSVEGDKYWSLHDKTVRWHSNRSGAHIFVLLID